MNRFLKCTAIVVTLLFVCLMVQSHARSKHNLQRFGMVTELRKEKMAEYKNLHTNAWPGVLKKIRKCNIRNYSIYLKEIKPGRYYLFSYFEYIGSDFDADMRKMAADSITQKWWKFTDPCQRPLPTRAKGEKIWSRMEEVFHAD